MKVIIDHSRLNEAFSRMVDPALRSHDIQDHEDAALLRKTLAGDRVPVLEHCLESRDDARFVVLRAEHIEGTNLDLYGVCLCDEAGKADLARRGLIAEDDKSFALLGPARFAAAEQNTTQVRRAFTAHFAQDDSTPFPRLSARLADAAQAAQTRFSVPAPY